MASKTQDRSKVSFALPSLPSVPTAPLEIDYSGGSSGDESGAEDRYLGSHVDLLNKKLATHQKKKVRKAVVGTINRSLKEIEKKDGDKCLFIDSRSVPGKPCTDYRKSYRDRKTGKVIESRYCAEHRYQMNRKNKKKAEQAVYDVTTGENDFQRRIHKLGPTRSETLTLEERMRNLGVEPQNIVIPASFAQAPPSDDEEVPLRRVPINPEMVRLLAERDDKVPSSPKRSASEQECDPAPKRPSPERQRPVFVFDAPTPVVRKSSKSKKTLQDVVKERRNQVLAPVEEPLDVSPQMNWNWLNA